MSQLTLHCNQNRETAASYPLLRDFQSELPANLATRVVVPLWPAQAMNNKLIKGLTLTFKIDGNEYAMLTPQRAGVANKQLGPKVRDLARYRDDILAALDLLITGLLYFFVSRCVHAASPKLALPGNETH